MSSRVLAVAWYRFRATWHARWGSYLAVVLLVGLVGGIAMASLAGARRTQSAFPAYLAATNASDLQLETVSTYVVNTDLLHELAHLHGVAHVAESPALLVLPLGPNRRPLASAVASEAANEVATVGSINGEFFGQDRVAVEQGRMANPDSTSEMVATAAAAKVLGWHLGERVTFDAYSLQEVQSSTFQKAIQRPSSRFSATLVGLVVFSTQVVDDDVDRYPTFVLMTPALTQRLPAGTLYPTYGLRLEGGNRDVAMVEREIIRLVPRGTLYNFHLTSVAEGQVERATRPEAIALGLFGAITALAALAIGGQAISRGLWAERDDLDVLRALGSGPATLTWSAVLGQLVALVLGAALAVGVAVALSPLAPVGRARQVDPAPGVAFDWAVIGTGFLVLVAGPAGRIEPASREK